MKTIELKYFFALAGVAFATLTYADETNNTVAAITPMSGTLTPQQFVMDAAVGGLKEVKLGRVALEKSQNSDVKQFAETMIRDHSAANKRLEQIAVQKGLSLPGTNTFSADDPKWKSQLLAKDSVKGMGAETLTATNESRLSEYRTFRHLESLFGPAFDQAYINDMVNDHAKDISMFEAATQNLTDPQLRQFAQTTLPTLRRHYQMAQDLANKLAGTPPSNPNTIKTAAKDGI